MCHEIKINHLHLVGFYVDAGIIYATPVIA
jgi:hypothetical protein